MRELPDFPVTDTLIFRDFPDVLSEQYAERSKAYASQLEGWKDDPWLIGYFLRNEPEFNFVEDLAIADEVLRNPARTCCREGLIRFLQEKYGTIEALNEGWGTAFGTFEALYEPIDACSTRYPGSAADIREYSAFLIREYIRVPAQACSCLLYTSFWIESFPKEGYFPPSIFPNQEPEEKTFCCQPKNWRRPAC